MEPAGMVAKPLSIIPEKLWLPGEVRRDWKKGNITWDGRTGELQGDELHLCAW